MASPASNGTNDGECPVVKPMTSLKGPMFGGTVITIYGSGLEKIRSWTLGDTCKELNVSSYSEDKITLTMPALEEPQTVCIILLSKRHDCNNISALNFTYVPNPVIFAFPSPIQTILEGGIAQTIYGSNLDAVETPIFHVLTCHYNKATEKQPKSTDCQVVNSSQIVCLTPNLADSVSPPLNDTSSLLYGTSVNDMNFNFNVTVTFLNFTVSVPTPLLVFQHPYLKKLTPLQPFIANENRAIEISGSALVNHGFTVSDIQVLVGNDECSDITLSDVAITCRPRPLKKDLIRYPPSVGANPAQPNVTVYIGAFKFSANQIQYTINESFNIIMIVMIAILAFIVVVSVVFGILSCCRCGQQGTPLGNMVAMPYEQMHDATDEPHDSDKEYMKTNVSRLHDKHSHVNETGIECRSMRYKIDLDSASGQGVSNEGYMYTPPSGKSKGHDEHETLKL
jgi:hypothetical protein